MGAGMTDWQARLSERREAFSKPSDTDPTKLTQPPFVGSVSVPHGPDEKSASDLASLRERLLDGAKAQGIDADLIHRLTTVDVAACEGLPGRTLHTYVDALETEAERMAGRVPRGETVLIFCAGCGPVWAPPGVAAILPLVSGTPRTLGCPWCHIRKARKYIPRPHVSCDTCQHYLPDHVNPEAGVGHCDLYRNDIYRMHYPMQRHNCADWQP